MVWLKIILVIEYLRMNKKVLLLLAMLLANIVSTWGVQVDTIMVKSSSIPEFGISLE